MVKYGKNYPLSLIPYLYINQFHFNNKNETNSDLND